MCEHGRPEGQMCPHCLGVNAAAPPEVDTVESLHRRLAEQGKAFCAANDREVKRYFACKEKHEAAVRTVTDASNILTRAMLNRDPTRRELMQVLERLQRVIREAKQ